VPVARAHERDEPHQLDEQLVRPEAVGPSRECADLRAEPPSRDVPVRTRMLVVEALRDRSDVV
jgi:hypothetical protein